MLNKLACKKKFLSVHCVILSYIIEASGFKGEVCDLYGGDAHFESPPKHRLS
jgi:hypothetical protein